MGLVKDEAGLFGIDWSTFFKALNGTDNPMNEYYEMEGQANDVVKYIKWYRDKVSLTLNAKMHPAVKQGKRTEDEILSEFLDTFELHHAMKHPEDRDGKITLKEFQEYYNNISSTIDNDQYFELMITNAWNLNNASYAKGWGGEI